MIRQIDYKTEISLISYHFLQNSPKELSFQYIMYLRYIFLITTTFKLSDKTVIIYFKTFTNFLNAINSNLYKG